MAKKPVATAVQGAFPTAPTVPHGLADIVAAGDAGMFTKPETHQPLVAAGLVEINPAITNSTGEVATRATPAGVATVATANVQAQAPTPDVSGQTTALSDVAKTTFAIDAGIAVPTERTRTFGAATKYPFDQLEVGQSFFVPNTTENPDAAKSMASTVASASKRYATDDPTGKTRVNRKGATVPALIYSRKFMARSFKNPDGTTGARIWRVL